MFKHSNVSSQKRVIEVSSQGAWDHIVEITTDLELNGTHPNFQQVVLDELLTAFAKWAAQNDQHWDRIRLVSG